MTIQRVVAKSLFEPFIRLAIERSVERLSDEQRLLWNSAGWPRHVTGQKTSFPSISRKHSVAVRPR